MFQTPNHDELCALRERVKKLTPEEQMLLAEHIMKCVRDAHFTDHEAYRREIRAGYDEMLAHEAAQKAASDVAPVTEAARVAG